jgi:hypothetical protein
MKAYFFSLKGPYRLWGPVHSRRQWVPEFFTSVKWPGREVTTRVHLVPGLRMSGGISLLPLYAFVSWTGKNLLIRRTGKETEFLSEFLGFPG